MKTLSKLHTLKTKNNSHYWFIILLCAFWCNTCFLDFCTVAVDHLTGFINSRIIIKPILFVLLFVKAFSYISTKLRHTDWIFLGILSIYYLSNFALYPQNEENLLKYLPLFFYALLFYILGIAMNLETAKPLLWYCSIINLLCSAFYNLIFIHTVGYSGDALKVGESVHDMAQAYYVLPSVIYILWITLERLNFTNIYKIPTLFTIALSILGFLLESAMGTRGPVVCIMVFVILYILFIKITKHKTIYRTITVCIALIASLFLTEFLLFMSTIISSLGMSNRVFALALDGTFIGGEASSEERKFILQKISKELCNNDINIYIGHGFTGFWNELGGYPHNIIYDFLLTFGILVGCVLIACFLYLMVKSFFKSKNVEIRGFLLVLAICGFVKLLFSQTFINEPFFFMLLGFCVSSNRNSNVEYY